MTPFIEDPPAKAALMLRHDVDFDVLLAEEMALYERDMGIYSTYFFMLVSVAERLWVEKNGRIGFSVKV